MIPVWMITLTLITSCKKYMPENDPITYGDAYTQTIYTDKAAYKPGDVVTFTLEGPAFKTAPKIRYRHFTQTLSETTLSGTSWTWTAPATDFTGYMVDLYDTTGGKENVYASIAVDVSSDWARFPRYGFLSKFGQLTTTQTDGIVKYLSRHHINGLQFYDWTFEHHQPLAGTVANPATTWKDIANRDTYKSTVQQYITAAHSRNMKAMSYNLAYGALNDAASAGVQDQWYMYKDQNHNTKAEFDVTPFLKSKIYLLDPGNNGWQHYLAGKNDDVYAVYPFDGFHIDQLGDWGITYNYNGGILNVPEGFKSFINAMKTAAPTKRLVMNAVNQYGQQNNIAQAPVDFIYTEVWGPNEGFKDLATIIQNNDSWSGGKKTCLAAYMNYDLANNKGYFNTPAILLTDAVIFAFGGSHLELGEHMLGREYFPNENLQMKEDLKAALVNYYDFLTAYQNLLRDGGAFNSPTIACTNNKMTLNTWPPQSGQVSVVGKAFANFQVLHFINLANANSLEWRDKNGTQTTPNTINDAAINFTSTRAVSKIWMASPDVSKGVSRNIAFTQSGSNVTFTLPSLKYWDMVVVEYQ